MLAMTPSMICWRVSSRKSRNGGPALLLTRMSGSGQAANSAFWPSGVATSAATAVTFAPVALRDFGGGGLERLAVAAVDDDLATGLREARGAGAAEPLARRADDGLAAGDAEIHGVLPKRCRVSTAGGAAFARPLLAGEGADVNPLRMRPVAGLGRPGYRRRRSWHCRARRSRCRSRRRSTSPAAADRAGWRPADRAA